MKNKVGYSLIELTIVVALVGVLSITISAIVLSTIVSSNRIKNQIRVRQSGDFTIGQINTLVRNARKITLCDTTNKTLTTLNQDNRDTTISLSGTQIASSSALSGTTVYMTPTDLAVSAFDISCIPDSSNPKLVNITFSLKKTGTTSKAIENPLETFTTSAEVRNSQ
jgi:type II secretory pathway pseudopilin PulG